MKILQVLLLVLFCTMSSFAQKAEDKKTNNSDKILIKTSPLKPLIGSVNLGVEFKVTDYHTLELEGSLLKSSIAPIRAFSIAPSNDKNLYYDISLRYKRFHKKWLKNESSSVFNGLYLAPGFKYGTRFSIFTNEPIPFYSGTIDLGISTSLSKHINLEGFVGTEILYYNVQNERRSDLVFRTGMRIGYIF